MMDPPFECTLCDYSVLDHSKFVDHLSVHQQSKVIQCPFCPLASNASALKIHMLRHRPMEIFDCSACDFSSNSAKSLAHHSEVYHNQLFKCEYCTIPERMTMHSLIEHWDEVHGIKEVSAENANKPGAQFEALPSSKPGCSCSMSDPEVLIKSEDAEHQEDQFVISAEAQGVEVAESNDESVTGDFADDQFESFSCQVCEFSTHLKVLLKYHILSMHTKKVTCKHCSALMTKYALVQHSKNAHGTYVYFDGKGVREATQSKVTEDSQAHSIDYPKSKPLVRNPKEREVPAKILCSGGKFICSICDFSTLQRMNLQQHIDKLHIRKYCCNNCPAIMTKYALVEHARLKHGVTLKLKNRFIIEAKPIVHSHPGFGSHGDEFDYKSEVDPERAGNFSGSTQIEVSRTIVQKGNLFICSICKYSHNWRPQLEAHTEKLHVKKYHCKHCPDVMNKYDLIEHAMAMHGVTMSVKTPGLKEFRQELDEVSEEDMDQDWQGMDDEDPNDTGFYINYDPTPNPPSMILPSNPTGAAAHDHSYVTEGKPGNPFACSVCDFSSHSESSLTSHMKFLHTVKYHCNHCPEIMTKFDIIKHSWIVHGVEIRPRDRTSLREAGEGSESQGDIENVSVTEQTMLAKDHFMGHFMDDTKNNMPNMQNGVMDTNDPRSCGICGFVAKYPSKLALHMDLLHTKKFCCPHCPEMMSKHELVDHGWSAHGVLLKVKNRYLKEVQDSDCSDVDDGMTYSDNDDTEYEPSSSSFKGKSTSEKACPFCDYIAPDFRIKVHVERMHTGKYLCEYCLSVMTKYDLIQHYKEEHGHDFSSRGYRGYRFKKADEVTNGRVTENQMSHLDGDSKYKQASPSFHDQNIPENVCSFCGYTSIPWNVQSHVQSMHGIKYHCEHCSVVMSKYDLIQHYESEHSIVIPPSNRSYKFKRAVEFTVGQESTNQAGETNPNIGAVPGPSSSQNKKAPSASRKSCSFCEYSSDFPKDVLLHENRLHRLKYHCEHCPVVLAKYDLLQHYKIKHSIVRPSNYRFKEAKNIIGQDFDNQMELIQSDNEYAECEELSFRGSNASKQVCSICGYVCTYQSRLEIHMERMHKKQFNCEHCSVVMTKHELVQHYQSVHDITVSKFGRPPFVEASDATVSQSDNEARPPFAMKSENHEANYNDTSSIDAEGGYFSCSVCDFSTKNETSLESHMEKWHRRKYVCNHCPAIMSKHDMIEHSKDIHDVILPKVGRPIQLLKPAEQDLLEQTGPNDLESVGPQQTDPGFTVDSTGLKCNVCGFSSQYRKSILLHIISMHRKKYSCNRCSLVSTKYELTVHSKNVHGVEIPWNGRGLVLKQVTQDDPNNDSQTGNSCRSLTPKSEMLEKKEKYWEKCIQADGSSQYRCTKCEFTSLYSFNLKNHADCYHSKLYCCNICPAVLSKYDLIQHYEIEHDVVISGHQAQRGPRFIEYQPGSGTEQYGPDQLGSMSAEPSTDNNESEFIHSVNVRPRSTLKPEIGEEQADDPEKFIMVERNVTIKQNDKDFICSSCGWSSKYKSIIQYHLDAMHIKKYGCKHCSVVMSKYDLIQHYRAVHSIVIPNLGRGHTGEFFRTVSQDLPKDSRSYVEPHSNKILIDNSSLNSTTDIDGEDMDVIKVGNKYKCTMCDKSSVWKRDIKLHFQSFHNKKYSCNLCSVILTKYDMIQHYETNHNVVVSGRGITLKYFKAVDHVTEGVDESIFAGSVSDRSVQDGSSTTEIYTDDEDQSMIIIQEGGEFKCSICGFSTIHKFNLKPHFECYHQKKYSCNRCSIILTKYDMIHHYETNHDVVISSKGHNVKYFIEVSHVSEGIDESIFTGGMADSSVQGGPSTTEIYTDDEDQSMTIIQEGGDFKCSICGFSTVHKFNLKPHFESFHQKKYSCNRCSVVTTKYGIVRHYESTHRFVIPNHGKGNLGPYCKAVGEFSEVLDSSVFADGIVETVMDDASIAEVDGAAGDKVDPVMDDPSTVVFDGHVEAESTAIIVEGGEFKCSICGYSSSYKSNVRSHGEALHQKKYSCNRCSLITNKYDMIRHYETDHNVVIAHMGKGFGGVYYKAVGEVSEGMDSSVLADDVAETSVVVGHWISGIDDDNDPTVIQEGDKFKCSVCGHTAALKGNVKVHIDVFHKKKYSCNRCSVVLTKYEMIQHYETDHNVQIDKSSRGSKSKYFKDVYQGPEAQDSSVITNYEPESSGSEWVAEIRTKNVGGDFGFIFKDGEEFKCSICDQSSLVKGCLEKHLAALHKKKFTCNRCSVVMTKYDMMQHYENDHGVEIPNKGRGVTTQYFTPVDQDSDVTDLGHTELHNSDLTTSIEAVEMVTDVPVADVRETDAFKCTVCDFSTKWKCSLKTHMETLHTKKYSCNQCSVILTRYEMILHCENDHGIIISKSTPLQLHFLEASHVPDDDPTSFVDGGSTVSAGDSEDGGSLACTVCDFSTKYSTSIESHMVNFHKKKFVCDHCPAILTKYTLIKHCKNVHGVTISLHNRNVKDIESATKGSTNDGRSCSDNSPTDSSAMKTIDYSKRSSSDNPDLTSRSSDSVTGFTMFKCSLCDYSSKLRMHLQVHAKNMHSTTLSCNLCSMVMTKYELLSHYKNVHTTPSTFSRNVTQFNPDTDLVPEDDTQDRIMLEQPGPSAASVIDITSDKNKFTCTICEFSTHVKFSLTSHIESLHQKKYHCNHCSAIMTKHELISHCKNDHGVLIHIKGYSLREATADSSKEYDDVSDAEAMQARKTFCCTTCDFTTKVKWYMKDHMEKFHRRKYCCTHCPAVMTKHVLIKHCKNVHGVTWSSRQPFSDAEDLNSTSSATDGSHKSWNYAEPSDTNSGLSEVSSVKSNANQAADQEFADKAQCPKCEFSTRHWSYLNEHIENFHKKKYRCGQCSAVMTKYELRAHSKERHGINLKINTRLPNSSYQVSKPGENHAKSKYNMTSEFKKPKRFPCSVCPFSSFHPFGLKRHVKLHHTIKYPCQHCPVVMTRYALIKHCRNVHNTQIPDNQPDVSESVDIHTSKPRIHPTGDSDSTRSQVVNPKFQAQQRTAMNTFQSPAFQPFVILERLPIDVDDLDSTFSVVDSTNTADPAMVTNPKFHDPTSQFNYR